jgi:hypothetical protein
VEQLDGSGNWNVVLVDGDWDTRYTYYHHDLVETYVVVEWNIAMDTIPGNYYYTACLTLFAGTYRIQTFGTAKDILGNLHPYTGTSSSFTVQ